MMQLWSESFEPGGPIPETFAFGRRDAEGRIALAGNRSPHLAWSGVPAGARSLALVCHDPDVPSRPDDVNQPGGASRATCRASTSCTGCWWT